MAASIPHQNSSDYTNFSSEVCGSFTINGAMMNMVPLTNCYDTNSPVSVASFPDQFVVPQLSEVEMGFGDFVAYDYRHRQIFEPGELCSGLLPNYSCPAYSMSMPAQNWGIMQGQTVTKVEEADQVKVGRYTVEEKKDRILRYLKKRNQRNFNKTIKYACRKTLADKRVRVRGRFAKNNEQEIVMNAAHDSSYEQNNLFYEDTTFQMKYEEDDWLQTAMANLVHLPYLAI